MAGRGGNKAEAAEGRLENFPADIERAGEKLLQCLTNRNVGLISVRGCEGVGRWRITKHATRKLNDSYLFDVKILVELWGENFSLRKAQREIARQLGMTTPMDGDSDDDEESIDEQVATKIYKLLMGWKFLLVIGDVRRGFNFELIGDPYLRNLQLNDSKIVVVGPQDLQYSDMAIELKDLSMDVLREEAVDISRSPSIRGCLASNTVLDCFLYLLLFNVSWLEVEMLKCCWRTEGFTVTEDGEEEDLMKALLTELQVRSMVVYNRNYVRQPENLVEKVKALATSSERSRLWIKNHYQPKEDDKVEDIQWMAVQDFTELSPLPPKCPKLSTLVLSPRHNNNIVLRISDNLLEQIPGLRITWTNEMICTRISIACRSSCLMNREFLSCPFSLVLVIPKDTN